MDDMSGLPLRLLYQLEQGQIAEADLEILEAMVHAEGLEVCPTPLRLRADRLALRHHVLAQQTEAPAASATRLARLIFDSWRMPQLVTLRGPGLTSRQLLLQAQDTEISLHVRRAGVNRIALIGQVLGPERSPGSATLHNQLAPSPVAAQTDTSLLEDVAYGPATVDSLGEFAFDQVLPGRYVLSLHLSAVRIDSIALDLGAQPGVSRSLAGD